MKTKIKKLAILLVLWLVFPLIVNVDFNFGNKYSPNVVNPKSSGGYTPSFIHIDGSITDNWSNTANDYGWCNYKNGFYVIENVTIDAISSPTGSGIYIENSHFVNFRIQNCTVGNATGVASNYAAGIKLQNCSRGVLFNNTCTDSKSYGWGILLEGDKCYNITIERNVVKSIQRDGIASYGGNKTYIINNTISNCYYRGICLYDNCENFTIAYNYVEGVGHGSQDAGVCLYNYNHNNSIYNNTLINNQRGIFLRESRDNSIFNNTVKNNYIAGIILRDNSNNNIITDNIASNDHEGYDQIRGIRLYDANYNNITNNVVNNNTYGIELEFSCQINNISGNSIRYNNLGIYLRSNCDNNTIMENTINENEEYGIYLQTQCDNNTINNNTINRNTLGILLNFECNDNTISGNTLMDNDFCIFELNSFSNKIENNDCSPPKVQEPIFIDGTATGVGAHNWTWAKNQTWCSGSGSWTDPYILDHLIINGFGILNGIEIKNSNAFFIIQSCEIFNTNSGIELFNVNNSHLIENNCSANDQGIYLEESNNNTISGNIANSNDYGISLVTYCNNNTILGNTANINNDDGIYIVESCIDNIISGNIINDNGDCGILLGFLCNNNNISGNIANNNDFIGIYIVEQCMNNVISDNTINDNGDTGIYLDYLCDNNTISRNTANNNTYDGITLFDHCNYNTISNNFVNDTGEHGIIVYGQSGNNNIYDNTVNYNGDIGIEIRDYCSNNTISSNFVRYNGLYGIGIFDFSNNNTLTENLLYNNTYGVYIDNGDNNSIYENFFIKNLIHSYDNGTDNNWNSTTIGNYWDNHTGPDINPPFGIVDVPYTYIGGFADSIDHLPIAEDGAPRISINSPSGGDAFSTIAPNFDITITEDYLDIMWYTLDGGLNNYTCTENGMINQSAWDEMDDGIITLSFYATDIPGYIGSANINIIKDTIAPIIIINSPAEGEKFGKTAPMFNITVDDDNLDAKWYSFDGGLTTYAITNNTVFNQTAWAALAQGNVTITFYARDLAGNEASKSVTVTKSVPSGLDPGVIITIIIVSVVGGVAVISIVYIYMKKRAVPG